MKQLRLTQRAYQDVAYMAHLFNLQIGEFDVKKERIILTFDCWGLAERHRPSFIQKLGLELIQMFQSTTRFVVPSTPSYDEEERKLTIIMDLNGVEDCRLITEEEFMFSLFPNELGEKAKTLFDKYMISEVDLGISHEYEGDTPVDFFYVCDTVFDPPVTEILEAGFNFESGLCAQEGYDYLYNSYGWMGQFFQNDLPEEFFKEFVEIHEEMYKVITDIKLRVDHCLNNDNI